MDVSKYIGIKEDNCYNFLSNIYNDFFNSPLPKIDYRKEKERDLLRDNQDQFLKIRNPKKYSLLIFILPKNRVHLGMYVGKDRFIHTTQTGSVITHLDNRWRKYLNMILWKDTWNGN